MKRFTVALEEADVHLGTDCGSEPEVPSTLFFVKFAAVVRTDLLFLLQVDKRKIIVSHPVLIYKW